MKISPVLLDNINFGSRRQFKKLFKVCSYSGENFEQHDTRTIEHILPVSLGGKNKYSNYLVVKRSWNGLRSSEPLDEFIKKNPEVEENIVKSVKALEGQTIEGIDWATEVKKTLKKVIGRDIFEGK